jgi:hypothetical protein
MEARDAASAAVSQGKSSTLHEANWSKYDTLLIKYKVAVAGSKDLGVSTLVEVQKKQKSEQTMKPEIELSAEDTVRKELNVEQKIALKDLGSKALPKIRDVPQQAYLQEPTANSAPEVDRLYTRIVKVTQLIPSIVDAYGGMYIDANIIAGSLQERKVDDQEVTAAEAFSAVNAWQASINDAEPIKLARNSCPLVGNTCYVNAAINIMAALGLGQQLDLLGTGGNAHHAEAAARILDKLKRQEKVTVPDMEDFYLQCTVAGWNKGNGYAVSEAQQMPADEFLKWFMDSLGLEPGRLRTEGIQKPFLTLALPKNDVEVQALVYQAEFKHEPLPKRFVLNFDRAASGSKNMHKIKGLDGDLKIGAKTYRPSVIIYHDGASINSGHYDLVAGNRPADAQKGNKRITQVVFEEVTKD